MLRKLMIGIGLMAFLGGVTAPAAAAAAPAGPLATVIVQPQRVPADRFIPPHTQGDADFNGNGPRVTASATLLGLNTRQLRVTLTMDAVETIADFTRANGTRIYPLFDVGAGNCIRGISRSTGDAISYTDTNRNEDVFDGQDQGGFVRQWRFVGDTAGNEAGIRTGAAVVTHDLTLNVQPGGC